MIKKGRIKQLIQTYDLESLEQHLIYSYLTDNLIVFNESSLLLKYFKDFEENSQMLLDTSSLGISSIKELENYLELIIPAQDRKLNGAFFTPDYIIDFIINQIKPEIGAANLDPSCGCGAFLVGLTDYYRRTFNKTIRNIIQENIYGSDILDYNILRTKLILTIYALQNGEHLDESDFNLYNQDSLRTEWKTSFDNVVGNPPYVKFQDLSEDSRDYLTKHWATVKGGTFNLYFAFFELGHKLLKPSGKLGYITPNNYFTSLAGEALRRYFQQHKCVTRIVDFSHIKVFDAQTYTAITFLNKNQNEAITYDRIKNEQTPELFLANANGSPNPLKNLAVKKWRLLKSDEQQNIKIIETIGNPIGKLFDICVGIATLKDEIFFVEGDNHGNGYYTKITDNGKFDIEVEIVKSVYKISDFRTQEEVWKNTRKIIFPYQIKNGVASVILERDFEMRFPKCYAYLLSERETLLARDKGKVVFDPFYAWGRTQGLTRTGKRIINPTFSQHPRFLLVEEEDAFFTNGYGLYFKEQESSGLFDNQINPVTKLDNIDVVQKILNSYIMDYYISRTSVSIEGGYPCYQKNFIEKFNIPVLDNSEIEKIRSLKNKIEIDEYLIEMYQLKVLAGNLV